MNDNIVKMQIFHKIKYYLRGHSRSQIMTFLIKNLHFLLFMLLIDWRKKCRWTLWKNKVWLIQRRHLPCFDPNLRSYGQLFVLVFLSLLKFLTPNWYSNLNWIRPITWYQNFTCQNCYENFIMSFELVNSHGFKLAINNH